ncbi:MAG: hypothetical protein AAF628_08950 [Planctomycetota bacterium]
MLQRFLCYLIFSVIMALSIAGSALVVVFLYLPFVALKAVFQVVAGKARIKTPAPATES